MTEVRLQLEDTMLLPEAETTNVGELDKHADKADDGKYKDASQGEEDDSEGADEVDNDDEERAWFVLQFRGRKGGRWHDGCIQRSSRTAPQERKKCF